MKGVSMCCVFVMLIYFAIQNADANTHKDYRPVDSLLEILEQEDWRDDPLCKEATFSLLNGVRNQSTWAVWIWDSMQTPVAVLYGSRYHMGSFEQCLEDPWSQQPTQYCLVDVTLTNHTRPYEEVDPNSDVKEFVGFRTKYGDRRINFYSIGICLPAVCSPSSVAKISRHIHHMSHLPIGDVTVDPSNCQVKNGQVDYNVGFYIFWTIIFCTTTITASVYLLEGSTTNSHFITLAKWFSPSKNFEALTKTNQDEVMSLNGIRAFSAGTTVILHYYLLVAVYAIINPVDAGNKFHSLLGAFVVQLSLIVDVFFMLSGLLLMKGFLTTRSSLVEMIIKRYLRLIGPVVLCLLYLSAVLPHTTSGPLYPKSVQEASDLTIKNWRLVVLMINNFVRTTEISPFITWYLSCDFQLTVLGTMMYWFCRKCRRQVVMKIYLVVYLLALIIPAVMTYWYQLPAKVIFDVDISAVYFVNQVFQTTYIKPYCRAGAFMIGLGLGYIMHVYKPKDYRNTISKTRSIFGGILGFFIIFSVMGLGGLLNRGRYDAVLSSVYTAFDRSLFALGTGLLIVVTEYGTFPIVGDFLASKVFVPFSRLSYGLFLYHPILIWQNLFSARAPQAYDFFHLLVNGFGYIVVGLLISYLVWFIVEAPMMNITNSLFRSRISASSHTKTDVGKISESKKEL